MAKLEFWSLENYWRIFSEELRQTEPLANWPHLLPLLYFAFYAGAGHLVSAISNREELDATPLCDMLVEYAEEELAAMIRLSPRYKEASLRQPNAVRMLAYLKSRAADYHSGEG